MFVPLDICFNHHSQNDALGMSHITSKLEISKHRNYSLYSLFMHKHRYLEIPFSGHQNAEHEQNETLNKQVQK